MISYFKYVPIGAFTLQDGTSYSGMVNVVNGNVYTGSILNANSKLLSSTKTFLPQVIESKIDFGPTYNTPIPVSKANISQRDILNYNTVKTLADTLDTNNLNIYANQITYNSNIFNTLVKTQDQLTYTYCLTSVNDTFTGKKLPKFRVTTENTLFSLVSSGSRDNNTLFLTSSGGVYYYYNNSNAVTGNFNISAAPTIKTGIKSATFDHKFIQFNPYNNTLFHTTTDTCFVYNFSYGESGATLTINDSFDISAIRSLTDRRNSVYGSLYRTALVQDQGVLLLEISYTTNPNSILSYTADDLGFNTLNRVIQRFEDDLLVVIGNIDSKLHAKVYDVSQLLNNTQSIYTYELVGCLQEDVYELAGFDSDIFFVKRFNSDDTLNSLELRSVQSGSYPIATFTQSSLLGMLKVNQIIDQINTPINTAELVLLPDNAISNNNNIKDIQFSVSETFNAFIKFTDSFSIVNNLTYLNLVPLSLDKRYFDIDINDNSIGLNINNILKNLIYDTVKLYLSNSKQYSFSSNGNINGLIPTIQSPITTDNLYLYENEYINVGVLNRLFNELYNIQEKLSMNTNSQV